MAVLQDHDMPIDGPDYLLENLRNKIAKITEWQTTIRGGQKSNCLNTFNYTRRKTMNADETIVLYNSKAKYIKLLIGCSVFVIGGSFIVYSDHSSKSQMIGWLNIVFFGLGMLVAIRQLLDKKARIVIDSRGITDNTLKVGLIEWRDIEEATLTRIQSEYFIQLELASESKYLDRLSTGHKRAAEANTVLGYQRLSINLSGVKCDAKEILNLVRHESGYARNAGQ